MIDGARVISDYRVQHWYDAQMDRAAHAPFTPEYVAALATAVARSIFGRTVGPRKVIAVDCDQTLWNGICAEDGVQNIVVDSERTLLQEFLVKQQQAGALLCLCSKNEQQTVFDVFQHHTNMPLTLEHLASWRINRFPKSKNLRDLAQELGLALDSFVFLDDDPIECAEVRNECPEVLTLQWMEDGSSPEMLRRVWCFDRLHITDEDRRRSTMYRQNIKREQARQESASYKEFLKQLALKVELTPLTEAYMARASQLTLRTNQFNTTGTRKTEEELRSLQAAPGSRCFLIRVTDRFGDYGWTGLVIINAVKTFRLELMLLSCRVLGKGVERIVMSEIGRMAVGAGYEFVDIKLVDTGRNLAVRDFFERISRELDVNNTLDSLRLPVSLLVDLRPESPEFESIEGHRVDQRPSPAPLPQNIRIQTEMLRRLATKLIDAESILHEMRSLQPSTQREGLCISPRTETERIIAEIWREVLNVQEVSVTDGFIDLGGQSLQAMQVLVRVQERFDAELSLEDLFNEKFTIESTAQAVQRVCPVAS
jgi:FkbH-like protein